MSLYQLSIEEVGFIMGYLGDREAAAGYLVGLIGQQNNDNLSGRIVAASHSLVARGILTVGADPTETSLNSDVAELIKTMISSEGSLRCEKIKNGQDELLSIFLSPQKRIAHHISSEVIANIEDITEEGATERCVSAFISAPSQADETPLGEIPLTTLEEIRNELDELTTSGVTNRFAQHLTPSTAETLALGLKEEGVEWGSVMRLETANKDADTLLEANSGILYAHTSKGLWLFHIDARADARADTRADTRADQNAGNLTGVSVTIYPGSQPLIAKLTKTLFL